MWGDHNKNTGVIHMYTMGGWGVITGGCGYLLNPTAPINDQEFRNFQKFARMNFLIFNHEFPYGYRGCKQTKGDIEWTIDH